MYKDINIRLETIKLQGNTGNMLFDISFSNIFLNMSPQVRKAKAKINKWDYIKLKTFFTVKETKNNNNNKRLPN